MPNDGVLNEGGWLGLASLDREWMVDAKCVGLEPAMFFPDEHDHRAIARAKRYCEMCPVRDECLDYAMEAREPDGIWGGLTSIERRSLRRREQKAARAGRTP